MATHEIKLGDLKHCVRCNGKCIGDMHVLAAVCDACAKSIEMCSPTVRYELVGVPAGEDVTFGQMGDLVHAARALVRYMKDHADHINCGEGKPNLWRLHAELCLALQAITVFSEVVKPIPVKVEERTDFEKMNTLLDIFETMLRLDEARRAGGRCGLLESVLSDARAKIIAVVAQ